MFERGFTWGGFNPVHKGHLVLLESGLKYIDHIDVYVGKKQLNYRLPHEIRTEALRTMIFQEGLEGRVRLLDSSFSLKDVDVSEYSVLLAGSDLLNHMSPYDQYFKEKDRNLIRRFDSILMVERLGEPLTQYAREEIIKSCYLSELPGISPFSSTAARSVARENGDLSKMVPEYVLPIISDYIIF